MGGEEIAGRFDARSGSWRWPLSHGRGSLSRVVSLVRCDASPVGGVTTWSRRLARAFADGGRRYDARTLLIATHPDSIPSPAVVEDGLTHTCVIDPTGDQFHALRAVREAIDRLEPDIVLPNYSDICYAAAAQHSVLGTRIIAIAHTDHEWYRNLIGTYDVWDAAVGVSDACMGWLLPLSRGRPLTKIVYGVPVSGHPRRVNPAGPLRLAYIGRMVEVQKLEHARGKPGGLEGLRVALGHKRGLRRRFKDHAIAREERRDDRVHRSEPGIVPRRDDEDDAERLAPDETSESGLLSYFQIFQGFVGDAAHVYRPLMEAALQLSGGLADRAAHLPAELRGEVVGALDAPLGHPPEDRCPLGYWNLFPGLLRSNRLLERTLNLRSRCDPAL